MKAKKVSGVDSHHKAHAGKGKIQAQHIIKRDRNGLTRCRVCGCTEMDACAPSCSWVDADLCSVCQAAVDAMVEWFHDARRANFAALRREYERQAFDTPIPYTLTAKAGAR